MFHNKWIIFKGRIQHLKTIKNVHIDIYPFCSIISYQTVFIGDAQNNFLALQCMHRLDFYLWDYLKFIVYSTPTESVEVHYHKSERGFQQIQGISGYIERVITSFPRVQCKEVILSISYEDTKLFDTKLAISRKQNQTEHTLIWTFLSYFYCY